MNALLAVAALGLAPLALALAIRSFQAPLRYVLPVYAAVVPWASGVALPLPLPGPFRTITTLVGLVAAGCFAAHRVLCTSAPRRLLPEVIAWVLFAGVNAATYFWSISPSKTFDGFLILASVLGLYVLLVLMPIDDDALRRLELGTILGGAGVGAWAVFQLATGTLPEENAGLPRFSVAGGLGDAADPNITAAVLVLPLVVSISAALFGTRQTRRILGAAAAVLVASALLLTASRGGLLAATIAALIVVLHHRRRLQVLATVGVLAFVVLLTFLLAAPEQVERLERTGSSGRTDVWRTAVVACTKYCSYGSGLDTFPDVQEETLLDSPQIPGFRLGVRPHNIWLGAAVETGVVSILLMVIALGLTIRGLLLLPAPVRAGPLAAVCGLLISNMFLGNLRFKYFWLVLMYAAATSLAAGARRESALGPTAASDPLADVPARSRR